ncbi:protein kinase domain-containing protein [Candidatus Poriferisocius sp.]|uniref:Stk1 family PASTA domain-containing Ser/Thr kinase n=1 Tax=Candidatus Poriferisocius sp. TaxID=3101276 RepID=UPI003B01606B
MSQGSGETGVIGRVLGGRFRLAARIGAGRFTEVYLAYDLAASRQVAVKLLPEEILAEANRHDPLFAARFLEAAEEAAAVNHPHLVAVYDWGDSDIGLYVVSEYVMGGSLGGILGTGYLLSPSQALLVGLEASRGLEHLHSQGFVHLDVRPSNILFDSRGRVRLADRGTSWIMTSSGVGRALMARSVFMAVDEVRYASPEQAQGLTPGHKSDVYSLVLVLTEALSGRVPFESDDPEYTQMAKMSRHLDLAGQFGRLGRVLEQAGRPERNDRPSARDLSIALLAAAESLPRPGPLPLSRALPEIPEPGETAGQAGAPAHERRQELSTPSQAAPAAVPRLLLPLVALLLLGAVGFGAYTLWDNWFGTETQPVPDLAGATEADLVGIENEFGWVLNRREQRRDGTVAGQVLGQAPQPGTALERGKTVTVWISLGPELALIPSNLAGLAVEDAVNALEAAGLSAGEITERYDESMLQGVVIEVDEMLPQAERGSRVGLVVSLGPMPRLVPEINAGTSLALALEELEEAGLGVLEWRVENNQVEADHVVRVEPAPGTEVAAGSVVTVVVSDGPEQVRVPFLATLGVEEAAEILESIGLCRGEIEGPPDTEVLATNPPAEAVVDFGACISLITRAEES